MGNQLRDMLNAWPILARFERSPRAEGFPFSEEDMKRVVRLRRAPAWTGAGRLLPGAPGSWDAVAHEEVQAGGCRHRLVLGGSPDRLLAEV